MRLRAFLRNEPPTRANPAPSPEIARHRYYHGVSREDFARRILNEGLQPLSVTQVRPFKAREHLMPMTGHVYLTRDLQQAMVYVLGGSYAGAPLPARLLEEQGRWGYLVVIEGASLRDVRPDEDAVGEAMDAALAPPRPGRAVADLPAVERSLCADAEKRRELAHLADRLTDRQRAQFGFLAGNSAAGKKVMPHMTPALQQWLIEQGASIAHAGALTPNETWRFDKTRSPELRVDGSNFFELAERSS